VSLQYVLGPLPTIVSRLRPFNSSKSVRKVLSEMFAPNFARLLPDIARYCQITALPVLL